MMGDSGWPLGLDPVHSKIEEEQPSSPAPKIYSTSSTDETSNLETESSCSSNFFPADKPVTLGEILGMSFNHLAASSFRSIELHPASSAARDRNRGLWSLITSCRCRRGATSSSRFEDTTSLSGAVDRIYNNFIFEEEDGGVHSAMDPVTEAAGNTTENPLFLLDLEFGHHSSRHLDLRSDI